MSWLEKYYEKKDAEGNKNGEKQGVLTVVPRMVDQGGVLCGGAGREGAAPGKSIFEQG